jgi:hypothetical protein
MKLPKFEHLYCGFTLDLPYRHKWGISISAKNRWSNIKMELEQELGRSIKVYALPVPILYARTCEQFVFRLFKGFKYNGLKTSTGRTEYFWSINFISFFLAWFLLYYFGVPDGKWKALFLLLIPAPLDGFLVILIIFLIQWVAILATFAGLIWYII